MLDREPFLRAIFAAPADDLPRLVFADWLEENGDPTWAELIRIGCRREQLPADDTLGRGQLSARQIALVQRLRTERDGDDRGAGYDRGFGPICEIVVDATFLSDLDNVRLTACRDHPEWYGATRLKIWQGPITTPLPLVTALTCPVTESVTELDVSGREVNSDSTDPGEETAGGYRLIDFTRRPTIHPRMVDALAGMRECRRLTVLDLRNNDLDNMALNALADSPYFTRLKRLRLSEGNRFRGRAWQRVLAKFGEDVAE